MILLIALGLGMGTSPLVVLIAGLAVVAPLPTVAVLLLLLVGQMRRSGRSRPDGEAVVLVGMAGDLRAGASLRRAIADGVRHAPGLEPAGRLAMAGRPIREVAAAVEDGMPGHGRIVAAAIRIAGRMGGPVAPVFEELAAQVIDVEELQRERRVAMAPALAQGVIVGGVPIVMVGWMAVTGRILDLVAAGPASAVLVVVGVLLTAIGVATVATMVWKATR